MQIADYLGQYANTLANAPAASPSPASGSAPQNLVSAFNEMQEGAVFEGSINAIDGTKILLGLSNGQTVSARLDGNVNLMLGQSVFFQVKSNDGNTIAIKPFMGKNAFNPTIQKALDAAGMEMTKDTIDMVNRMMEEGMPIDRGSLAAMRHTLMQNPQISLKTAVLMTKLGIPVNDQMAAQFENYQNDRHEVLKQVAGVMEELPGVFAKSSGAAPELLKLNGQILSILDASNGLQNGQEPELFVTPAEEGTLAEEGAQLQEGTAAGKEGALLNEELSAQTPHKTENEALLNETQKNVQKEAQDAKPAGAELPKAAEESGDVLKQAASGQADTKPGRLSELLNRHQRAELEAQLKEIFPKEENLKLNTKLTAKEILESLAKGLDTLPAPEKEALTKLFSGKAYHTLLKDVMEQQWTLKPEDLKTEHKVEELYQRLNRQMGQIEQLAKQTGMNTGQLSQSAAQVRENIEFMHQINQAYTYVQIPLKMANQNAHSDLYVYTNKRNLGKKEGELSAFLHLELENLGSTDVSIKMLDKNVSTKFYLSDDGAYDLIEANLPKLQARLEKLGYNCRVTVENREEKVDFVEDFLQKSQPATSKGRGMVHRYSFDVRA